MNKNIHKILVLTCAFTGSLITSCTDKDYYDQDKDPNYVDQKASTLDFSTSQTVQLQFNYNVVADFTSVFDLYTAYPLNPDGSLRNDITPIAGGMHTQGNSQLTRVVPSYATGLYLYSESLFVPTLSHAKIENGLASFAQIGINVTEESTTSRAGNAGNLWSRECVAVLKEKSDFYMETAGGHYKYDLINPDFEQKLPVEVLYSISTAFPERVELPATSEFIKDANLAVVEEAEIFITILHAGCANNNCLSYFVYTGEKEFDKLTKDEVNRLELITIYQLADANTNAVKKPEDVVGITPGKYIQLKYKNEDGELVNKFPKGAKIGWKLHRSGFDAATFAATNSSGAVFSVADWNDGIQLSNTENGTTKYTIYFSTTDVAGNKYNCFGFEDQRWQPDMDYNDLIFHIHTNPANALDPPPAIVVEDKWKTENKKGILAFEDNWPEKGDYDLNDVVITYSSNITYFYTETKENGSVTGSTGITVKEVEDEFAFLHNGASFTNTFSYKVDLSPDKIAKITVTDKLNGNTTNYTDKIEKDGNGFIIDLAINSLPKYQKNATPRSYVVTMEFKDGAVLQDDFSDVSAPYNPFITPKGNYEGAEVHLPMYPPTGRAKMELFNTEDDRSDGKTLWYVSGKNVEYPFALHLAGTTEFNIPEEGEEISTIYPDYLNWTKSGMTDSKGWYN